MKKDKYFNKRGGTAKIINVNCSKCGRRILIYQKDGIGWLKRCYLNRILLPENLKKYDKIYKNINFPNLVCECGNVIGTPTRHSDGRLAFCLIRRSFRRKLDNSLSW